MFKKNCKQVVYPRSVLRIRCNKLLLKINAFTRRKRFETSTKRFVSTSGNITRRDRVKFGFITSTLDTNDIRIVLHIKNSQYSVAYRKSRLRLIHDTCERFPIKYSLRLHNRRAHLMLLQLLLLRNTQFKLQFLHN